jgi:hypothetical protein
MTSPREEQREMEQILAAHGYDPKDARALQNEGMGPYELEHRLRTAPSGWGSLTYTHGLKKNPEEEPGIGLIGGLVIAATAGLIGFVIGKKGAQAAQAAVANTTGVTGVGEGELGRGGGGGHGGGGHGGGFHGGFHGGRRRWGGSSWIPWGYGTYYDQAPSCGWTPTTVAATPQTVLASLARGHFSRTITTSSWQAIVDGVTWRYDADSIFGAQDFAAALQKNNDVFYYTCG